MQKQLSRSSNQYLLNLGKSHFKSSKAAAKLRQLGGEVLILAKTFPAPCFARNYSNQHKIWVTL